MCYLCSIECLFGQIKDRIEQKCKGEFETSFLQSLLDWMETELLVWLDTIINHKGKDYNI